MSVQDIIYITPEEFRGCKENSVFCVKISDLYNKLLQGYDCFTKPDLVHLKFPSVQKTIAKSETSHSQHQHKHNHKKGASASSSFRSHNTFHSTKYSLNGSQQGYGFVHSASSHKRPQLKAISEADNDYCTVMRRQLKGLLNRINKNNFNKILSKVKLLVQDDTISTISDVILDTACCQVFYIDIFYHLLTEVRSVASDLGKSLVDEQINKFINDYINDEQYLYKGSGCENKYHEFCLLQKHKSLATSRNLVVVELIKNNHSIDWCIQAYCDNLLHTISNLEYNIYNENIENNIDIIISIIKDLKVRDPSVRITQASIDNLKTMLHDSQRLRFIVEDIAKS